MLPELEDKILEIKPSKLNASDSYAWLPSKSGLYTAKSGYYSRLNVEPEIPVQQQERDFNWMSTIWNIKSPPKQRFFLWKVMRGAVPVGQNLRERNINVNAACPFCGEDESTQHLFFTCTFASQIWSLAPFKSSLNLSDIHSFRVGLERCKSLTCLPPTGLGDAPLPPWILWRIWIARNQAIFNDHRESPQETISKAISLAREWQEAQLTV